MWSGTDCSLIQFKKAIQLRKVSHLATCCYG